MKAEWLANVDGQEYGPYTWQQMLQMAAEGRVPADLPVRRVSDQRWFKASQVPGLVTPAASPTAVKSAAAGASAAARRGDSSHLKRAKPLHAAGGVAAPPVAPPPPPPPRAVEPLQLAASDAAGFPVIVSDERQKPKSQRPTDDETEPLVSRRRKGPWLLVGIAVGVTAVALLAVTVVWVVWLRGNAPDQQLPLAAAAAEANPQEAAQDDSADRATRKNATASALADETNDNDPTMEELAAQAKLVQSIAKWQSLAGVSSITLSSANLQLTRIWRTAAAGDQQGSAGKHICIEVAIRNTSRSPLKYRGWNSHGPLGAILADEKRSVLPLVAISKTPDVERITALSVPGNSTVTDVLVFQAPASDDEVLHLVLPYGVFYTNVRPPYRAIEITPDLVDVDGAAARSRSTLAARQPEDVAPVTSGASPPAGADAPAGASKAAAAAISPKGVPLGRDGQTPSIKDLIDNDPGSPMPPDEPPGKGAAKTDAKGQDKKPQAPKKPENPFEPKPEEEPVKPAGNE